MYSLMKCSLLTHGLTIALCAAATVVRAQPNHDSALKECAVKLSLDSFRAHALANSPLVAEIDRDYANRLARAIETELLNNPELAGFQTWTTAYVNGAHEPQSEVSLSQPLRLSNFGKRDKVADLIRKAGDTERGIKLLEFTQQNTVNYVRLYSLQETLKVLAHAERDAANRVATASKQVKEGLLSHGSEAVFQGEKARIEAQRVGTEGSLAALQSEISTSIGTTCKVIASGAPSFTKIAPASTLLDKAQASRISEQARLQVLQELATEQTRLAELDAFPIFAPRVVYQHTNDGGDYVGAGITIPLPLFNRNQPDITQASAEREASRRKADLVTKGGLSLLVSTAHAAAMSAQRQVEIYTARVEPSFKTALEAEERSYLSGKGSILEVWQTFRALNEAQVTGLALWQHAAMARARLSILVGEEV